MLAREYSRIGYWDGAIEENTKALEINPKEPAYIYARANANYRKGEWTAAAIDFDRAAELDARIENIDYLRGYAHRAAGNFEKAREILEKFLATHPDHVDALSSLGYVAIEQGRLDDAEAPLMHALQISPEEIPVLYDYARLALKRREYAEAVRRLEKVVNKLPTLTQAHYQLFLAYSRLKQADKAQIELAEFKRLEALEKQVEKERILDEKLRTQQLLGRTPQ
jgi:tetratricopeptide (TPR) repeat protein